MNRSSSRGPLRSPFFLLLLATGACAQTDNLLMRDDLNWLWLVVPLLGIGLVGAIVIFFLRRGHLRQWDLRISPSEPAVRKISLGLIAIAAVIAIAFSVYNFFAGSIDPAQRLYNIGFWLLGTILGILAGLFLGLLFAERPLTTGGGR